ncbi:MAG: hypothetical protein NTV07_01205 [Candidatus Omnitrophica bacterium]|nr:hypothetical protein [Candidatus Omnitrophota bacterium]
MVSKDLARKLNLLGFPLFEAKSDEDLNKTLAEVVESRDPRLLEAFPVLLANGLKNGTFEYKTAAAYLKNRTDRDDFSSLLVMSAALYKVMGLKFSWAEEFYKSLPPGKNREYNSLLSRLKAGGNFKVGRYTMSGERLKSAFANYFNPPQSGLDGLLALKTEYGLEYALSQVFSPKQKELFLKKLKGEKLSKTEKEYFSRTVKKKVSALANAELHSLAQKAMLL